MEEIPEGQGRGVKDFRGRGWFGGLGPVQHEGTGEPP